ncbi:Phosphoenolpyruvate phosphatase [Platanthera zijinensis]|uniref:Phosphoenolpyruvate phosphatase n=1 Tax=Platanthera zijinensis TaxID=2320716 RepID=A0AAP0G3Z9_9ASPA
MKYTPQWLWLRNELKQVDTEKTPWLIIIMHSPLYINNNAHYMEGESMRAAFESWFVQFKIDLIFAGHAHAYERSNVKQDTSPITWLLKDYNMIPLDHSVSTKTYNTGTQPNHSLAAERKIVKRFSMPKTVLPLVDELSA